MTMTDKATPSRNWTQEDWARLGKRITYSRNTLGLNRYEACGKLLEIIKDNGFAPGLSEASQGLEADLLLDAIEKNRVLLSASQLVALTEEWERSGRDYLHEDYPKAWIFKETAEKWLYAVESILGWEDGAAVLILDGEIGDPYPPQVIDPIQAEDMWAGLQEPETEPETPQPENWDFGTNDIMWLPPESDGRVVYVGQDEACADLEAIHHNTLVNKVADMATSFIDALSCLEKLQTGDAQAASVRTAKRTAAHAFSQAIESIAASHPTEKDPEQPPVKDTPEESPTQAAPKPPVGRWTWVEGTY